MKGGLQIAFFGSSLVSAYWNGAATYYRGIIKALAGRGHRITFYEPNIYERQEHRDMQDPSWAKVIVYEPTEQAVWRALDSASRSDLLIKTSGVGIFDELLEGAILDRGSPETMVGFWDVDAPATLDRVNANHEDYFRALIPRYDVILTYGGGPPVVRAYSKLGARVCVPIYNALDPDTHHPAPSDTRYAAHLSLLANRLPDREARIDEFFFAAAEQVPECDFLLGGNGWESKPAGSNVRKTGHVFTRDHNALNSSANLVLNVSRDSMARYGFSPATRVFEAAGAGACVITDRWEGIELFLEPDKEVLVARDGTDVASFVRGVPAQRAKAIGVAALRRVLAEHTYQQRVDEVERTLALATKPRYRTVGLVQNQVQQVNHD
jgi:spore maturation protein CgeB